MPEPTTAATALSSALAMLEQIVLTRPEGEALQSIIANGPLLIPQAKAPGFVGVSRSAWFHLRSLGELPPPIDIPRVGLCWRKQDLETWVARMKPQKRTRQRSRQRSG